MVAGILDFRFRSFSLSARTDSSDPKFFLSSLRCRSVKKQTEITNSIKTLCVYELISAIKCYVMVYLYIVYMVSSHSIRRKTGLIK